jgi:hypothetical protein
MLHEIESEWRAARTSVPLRPVDDHADARTHCGANRPANDQACHCTRRGPLFSVVPTG